MRRSGLLWIAFLAATVTTPAAPDFSRVARDVVETCGSSTVHPSGPAAIEQAACRQRALDMLDTIESGKMRTRAFTRVKTAFARSCAPR
jgi:hypothetical protein